MRAERVREPGTDFDLATLRVARPWHAWRKRWFWRSKIAAESVYARSRHRARAKVREIDRTRRAQRGFELADMRAFDKAIPPQHAIAATRAAAGVRAGALSQLKRIVSVSLGSSSRDHRATRGRCSVKTFEISREGDGRVARSRAQTRLRELDGTVDAIGLGGIDVYLYTQARNGLRCAMVSEAARRGEEDAGRRRQRVEEYPRTRSDRLFAASTCGIDLRGKKRVS